MSINVAAREEHVLHVNTYQLRVEGEETHCELVATLKLDNIEGFENLGKDLYSLEPEDKGESAPEYVVFLTAPNEAGIQCEVCIHRIAIMKMAKFIKEETDNRS